MRVSRVELAEMLDVPGILDGDPVLSLQAHSARPGDINDLEQALPHGRELGQAFPGEDPPQDEVSNFEGLGADVTQW